MEFKTGRADSPTKFEPFEPVEVLYEFDGPRIFTLRDSEGDLNLVYWSDQEGDTNRYVVVPTSKRIVASLHEGGIAVLDALDQPRCWLCDVANSGKIVACQRVDFEDVPRDSLPAADTMLLPSMEKLEAKASRENR